MKVRILPVAILCVTALTQCAPKRPPPPSWQLNYQPTIQRSDGSVASCRTMLLGPGEYNFAYVVVTMDGWVGDRKPEDSRMYAGEEFSGWASIGPAVFHDDSNGHDMSVTVIYYSENLSGAKARTVVACSEEGTIVVPSFK